MGLLLFMGKKKQAIVSSYSAFHGPTAPLSDMEREWIQSVTNEKRVVRRPIEKPIECPAEYKSYYDSAIDHYVKRLKRQKAFLAPKLMGLSQMIFQLSKNGIDIPKELLQAHSDYLRTVYDVQDRLDIIAGRAAYNHEPLFRALQEVDNA